MATIEEMYANVTFEEAWRTWQTSARRVFVFSPDAPDYSKEAFEKAVWDTHAMLRKLATHVIASAGVRDELVQPNEILIALDQREFIDSPKMQQRFELCADGYMVWLESPILHPQHIRRMDDGFFALLLSLGDLGVWKFESLDGDDKSIKSNIYHLIADTQGDDLSDFGTLQVMWPHEAAAGDLLSLAPRAFSVVHQLQYRLYRAEYQLRAGRKRK